MNAEPTEDIDRVRTTLSAQPHLLRVFEALAPALAERAHAVAVRGGVTKDRVDEHSDLDLAVILDRDQADAALAAADRALDTLGTVLARYSADHRGFPWLWVYLIFAMDTLVKIDVSIEFDGVRSSPDQIVVFRTGGFVEPAAPARSAEVGYRVVAERCIGWVWYVHTKIARGELAEAERALATLVGESPGTALVSVDGVARADCLIVATGGTAHRVLEAARALLLEHDVACEIAVPALLYPFDPTEIIDAVRSCRAVLVVEESTAGGTWGAEVAHILHTRAWADLRRPVRLVHSTDSIIPTAVHLERSVLVQAADISRAVLEESR